MNHAIILIYKQWCYNCDTSLHTNIATDTFKKQKTNKKTISDKTQREASGRNKITPIRTNKQEDRDDEK